MPRSEMGARLVRRTVIREAGQLSLLSEWLLKECERYAKPEPYWKHLSVLFVVFWRRLLPIHARKARHRSSGYWRNLRMNIMKRSSCVESNTEDSNVHAAEPSLRQDITIASTRGIVTSALAGLSIFWCLVTSANAQFAVDMPMDSPRAPFSIGASYAASIQFEGLSATGTTVLVGSAVKMPINFATTPFVLADIPGSKTVVATATALRVTFTVTGLTGWTQRGTWAVSSVPFATPLAIAAGQKVGCRYDMPTQSFTFDVNTGIITWGPPAGRLRCQPGVLASAIPATTATPAPTPVPTPIPGPIPTPVPQPVTKLPPAASIMDSTGGLWTAGPPAADAAPGQVSILLNGNQVKGSVTFICYTNGEMWDFDPPPPIGSGQGWEKWTGTAWGPVQATGPTACQ